MFRNVISLALAAFALAGCGRDEVKTYHVAKDESAAPQNQIAIPEQNSPSQLQFALPSGWQEKTPGQMRVASFAVTNAGGQIADVGVIPLPAGENELNLVNMWREQMQLPALTNETTGETVSVGDENSKLFDIASEQPLIDGKFRARIFVAELTRGDTSWFFKMTGEDSFVASQKENFLQFLKSISFEENSAAQISNAPVTQNQGAVSIWTIPSGWQRLPPSEFLVAKFLIQNDGAKAEVNVSSLAGEGGGLLANVNRWRGQLGLEPLNNEMELAHIVPTMDLSGGGHLTIVDFSGTDAKTGKPARLVGAIVPQSGQTWFYKLMGDEQIVAQQKDAFIEFIQSANYADAR
jgi:hypothetical protein